MDKNEIAKGLQTEFDAVCAWFEAQSESDFNSGPEGKWTAAQHLDHLVRSANPVNLAMRMPKLALRKMFGVAGHESKSFDGVVSVYKEKLGQGGAASGRFLPKESEGVIKTKTLQSLKKEGERLVVITSKWTESDLDKYALPHPLIGKMTVREMLQFTIYHMQHHLNALKSQY